MSAPSLAQMEIGFGPPPSDPDPMTLAFEEFDRSNPGVYSRLVQLARAEAEAQRTDGVRKPRVSIKGIWEDLRKELRGVPLQGQRPVKLNNNFTAFFARLIAERNPDLAGVFKTRERNV